MVAAAALVKLLAGLVTAATGMRAVALAVADATADGPGPGTGTGHSHGSSHGNGLVADVETCGRAALHVVLEKVPPRPSPVPAPI